MLIDGDGLASLGSGFIEDMYNKYWRFIDVVGQMHVACPHLVQVWDVPLEKQSQDAKPRVGRVPNLVDDNLSQAAADAAEGTPPQAASSPTIEPARRLRRRFVPTPPQDKNHELTHVHPIGSSLQTTAECDEGRAGKG
jgi:hypothetical protein